MLKAKMIEIAGEQVDKLRINAGWLTGSATATTIKSPSSSSLELPSFMPVCVLPSPNWIKASLPRATSLMARCECRKR
jgi:hypothetical protein